MANFDVVVMGGGIVGLTAALAMARQQVSVAVIDAQALTIQPTPSLRVFALNHASQRLLQQLDVWPLIPNEQIAPYQRMHVWDAVNQASLDFDARFIASHQLGVIIDENSLKNALLQQIQQHKHITLFPDNAINTIQETTQHITLTNNNHFWQAKLLMIADGGDSQARRLLTIPITRWPYHQHAVVASVQTEKPHQDTAYQVFNPEGPLAFLPLVDKHHCSIVWSTTPARAQRLITLDEHDFNQQLTHAFAHHLGKARVQSKRHQFPLTMRHTQQYVGQRWLLLGDAAHTIHPLAGLGLNVGLADIAAWLDCLKEQQPGVFSQRMLQAYQRQRKYAVWQVIALMGGLKTLFANPLPPVAALRGRGIGLCDQFMPLKRWLIKQAVG